MQAQSQPAWFGGMPIDVIEDHILARLDGRSLGRLLTTGKTLRSLIDNNHPAWWSAHSQLLTGKLRMIRVTSRESHRMPQVGDDGRENDFMGASITGYCDVAETSSEAAHRIPLVILMIPLMTCAGIMPEARRGVQVGVPGHAARDVHDLRVEGQHGGARWGDQEGFVRAMHLGKPSYQRLLREARAPGGKPGWPTSTFLLPQRARDACCSDVCTC